MPELTLHQQVFAVVTALITVILVLELVRRRRLREEYSWLWLLTAGAMLGLALWYRLLLAITWLIGAISPITTLLICSVLFLLAIAVHYSIIISRLTGQVTRLAQEVALLGGGGLEGRR